MSLSISQLKDELISAGLSVKTPGLTGEDRFEELKHRLDMHQKKMKVKLSEESKGESNSGSELSNSAIGSLSIGELRSRLASLGENTSTPGLAGEERRSELMKRLVNAVCGDDVASSEIIENASKYSEVTSTIPA